MWFLLVLLSVPQFHVPASQPVPLRVDVHGPDGKLLNVEVHHEVWVTDPATGRRSSVWLQGFSRATRNDRGRSGIRGKGYWVPRGSEVRLAGVHPVFGLVEAVVAIPEDRDPEPVVLHLPRAVGSAELTVRAQRPDGPAHVVHNAAGEVILHMDGWSDLNFVKVCAPQTGIEVVRTTLEEAREQGIRLPRGEWEVVLQGRGMLMCGNGSAFPEDFVPARQRVRLDEDQEITLKVQRGGYLGLTVSSPDPTPSGWSPGKLRAYLVDESGTEHDLTWGYSTQAFAFPEENLPWDSKAMQIVPVPLGRYELNLVGEHIQPLRREVEITTWLPADPILLRPLISHQDHPR